MSKATVHPYDSPAYSVVAGWLGVPVPPPLKHRRKPYRKTAARRRGDVVFEVKPRTTTQLRMRV